MFAKVDWFEDRPDGWGIAPRAWQGWTYLVGISIVLAAVQRLAPAGRTRDLATGIVAVACAADALHVWIRLSIPPRRTEGACRRVDVAATEIRP